MVCDYQLLMVVLCIHAVSPMSILEEFQEDFIACVDARHNVLKLKRKNVIPGEIADRLKGSSAEEAKEILYDYLKYHCDVDTLREYFEVAAAADGCSRMQKFAKAMMQELQEKGWFGYVCIPVSHEML